MIFQEEISHLTALAVGLSNSNKGKLIDLFDGIKHLNQGILKLQKTLIKLL